MSEIYLLILLTAPPSHFLAVLIFILNPNIHLIQPDVLIFQDLVLIADDDNDVSVSGL